MKHLWLCLFLLGCHTPKAPVTSPVRYGTVELSRGQFDLPWTERKEIDYWIKQYTQKENSTFKASLKRGELYIPYIRKQLQSQNLPQDLVFLALIESGFNNYALSSAKALGVWQFMPKTAKYSNLTVSPFIDERRSPSKSTTTAIKYLKYLNNQFKDWHLTMAAYNFGEGNLRRVMKKHKVSDYWTLVDKKLIPKETRDYVPKILAAMIVVKNSNEFKLNYPHVLDYWSLVGENGWQISNNLSFKVTPAIYPEPFTFKPMNTYTTKETTDLIKLAKILRIPFKTLKNANPEITTWFAPENTVINLPIKNLRAEVLETYSGWLAPSFKEIKVTRSLHFSQLAKSWNVHADYLMALNPQFKSQQNLLGKTIKIPVPNHNAGLEILGVEVNPKKLVSIN